MPHKIEMLHVALSVDKDGDEGLIAMFDGEAWIPLVASGEERLDWIRARAIEIGMARKCEIRILRYAPLGTPIEHYDFRAASADEGHA